MAEQENEKEHEAKNERGHSGNRAQHESAEEHESSGRGKSDSFAFGPYFALMIVLLAGFVILNQYLISSMDFSSAASSPAQNAPASSGSKELDAMEAQILPKGVPPIYGEEIGIRYDDIDINDAAKTDAAMKKLIAFDDPNPKISNSLTDSQLKRFLDIGNRIGCEYCCGLGSMVTKDGGRPCSCLHSWAMRGVAQYLLKSHPEMTDDQILEEVGKWKTLFFPDNIGQKALVLKQKGIELTYINLASNKYQGIESGSTSGARQAGSC